GNNDPPVEGLQGTGSPGLLDVNRRGGLDDVGPVLPAAPPSDPHVGAAPLASSPARHRTYVSGRLPPPVSSRATGQGRRAIFCSGRCRAEWHRRRRAAIAQPASGTYTPNSPSPGAGNKPGGTRRHPADRGGRAGAASPGIAG